MQTTQATIRSQISLFRLRTLVSAWVILLATFTTLSAKTRIFDLGDVKATVDCETLEGWDFLGSTAPIHYVGKFYHEKQVIRANVQIQCTKAGYSMESPTGTVERSLNINGDAPSVSWKIRKNDSTRSEDSDISGEIALKASFGGDAKIQSLLFDKKSTRMVLDEKHLQKFFYIQNYDEHEIEKLVKTQLQELTSSCSAEELSKIQKSTLAMLKAADDEEVEKISHFLTTGENCLSKKINRTFKDNNPHTLHSAHFDPINRKWINPTSIFESISLPEHSDTIEFQTHVSCDLREREGVVLKDPDSKHTLHITIPHNIDFKAVISIKMKNTVCVDNVSASTHICSIESIKTIVSWAESANALVFKHSGSMSFNQVLPHREFRIEAGREIMDRE